MAYLFHHYGEHDFTSKGKALIAQIDYSGGCGKMRTDLIKEASMSKEKDKQKTNTKKKAQHTLKEKRQAKKEKAEGKSLQLSSL